MASYLKPRRGTYSTASSKLRRSADGVLKNGEIFFELNNSGAGKGVGKIKMGDGSTDYSSLPYFLSLQDSNITFTDNESYDQIGALVSGISIPDAFRHIKSSLAYLKTQVTNLNNDIVSLNSNLLPYKIGTYSGSTDINGNCNTNISSTSKFIIAVFSNVPSTIVTVGISSSNTVVFHVIKTTNEIYAGNIQFTYLYVDKK